MILVLELQRRQFVAGVKLEKVTNENIHGHAVGNYVVHVEDEHLLILGNFKQSHAQQRRSAEIEWPNKTADNLIWGPSLPAALDFKWHMLVDNLHGFAGRHLKRRPQAFVAENQSPENVRQLFRINLSVYYHGSWNIVGNTLFLHVLKNIKPFLR